MQACYNGDDNSNIFQFNKNEYKKNQHTFVPCQSELVVKWLYIVAIVKVVVAIDPTTRFMYKLILFKYDLS